MRIARVRSRIEVQQAHLPSSLRNGNSLCDRSENRRDARHRIRRNEWLVIFHNRSAAWLPDRKTLSCIGPR